MSASLPPPDPTFDLAQLHLALDMSEVGIWRMDIASQRVHANIAGFRMLGQAPRLDGWAVDHLMSIVHPDDREPATEAARRAAEQGRPIELLIRFQHQNGGWRQLLTRRMPIRDAEGKLVAFFGMAIDVTERLRDEQRLRDANQRIALIARSAGIGTWEWDLPEGVSRWDEQMFLLRGLPPAENAPSIAEMTRLVLEEDLDHVNQQLLLASGETNPTQYEFRVRWPDGQVRWLASRSVGIEDAQGHVIRRIGVNWDITAARQAEQERQATTIAQRESQAKSELLARMSHELRTPLNAILGFTELLIADSETVEPQVRKARLEHIRSAGRHLHALINDVLELARPGAEGADAHPLGPVPLADLFADTLPLIEGAAAQGEVLLRCEPGEPGLSALADPLWLKQVLLNLLTNAVKYNRPGGWVDLSARAESPDKVRITVRDGGVGMTAEALARAFEPFQRAAERQPGVPGVGIGLAVVKTLMTRMAGAISARSTPGVGSEFELLLGRCGSDGLPAATGMAQAPYAAAAPEPAASATRLVLYIEDNPVNVMIVQELARRRPGINFLSAPDGGTGLRMSADQQPDLILLDMQLPDMHGQEVLQHLRRGAATRRIPVVALSANAMPDDIRFALENGFADYWTKPLDFAVFNRAIDALLASPPRAR